MQLNGEHRSGDVTRCPMNGRAPPPAIGGVRTHYWSSAESSPLGHTVCARKNRLSSLVSPPFVLGELFILKGIGGRKWLFCKNGADFGADTDGLKLPKRLNLYRRKGAEEGSVPKVGVIT